MAIGSVSVCGARFVAGSMRRGSRVPSCARSTLLSGSVGLVVGVSFGPFVSGFLTGRLFPWLRVRFIVGRVCNWLGLEVDDGLPV